MTAVMSKETTAEKMAANTFAVYSSAEAAEAAAAEAADARIAAEAAEAEAVAKLIAYTAAVASVCYATTASAAKAAEAEAAEAVAAYVAAAEAAEAAEAEAEAAEAAAAVAEAEAAEAMAAAVAVAEILTASAYGYYTIIRADLRPWSILAAVYAFICKIWPQMAAEMAADPDYGAILTADDIEAAAEAADLDVVIWVIDDIAEAVSDILPPSHYYGGHPADPSDIGFWPMSLIDCPDYM